MPEPYRSLRIFISSPGDLSEERRIAESVISEVNDRCRDVLGVRVECDIWEHIPPITPNTSEETIQQIINKRIKQCDAFVLLLNKRYGSVKPGHRRSNTAIEIDVALEMQSLGRSIAFFSYFKKLAPNADQGRQETEARRLRIELEKRGLIYFFEDKFDFRNRFTHDLYDTILSSVVSGPKQRALSTFWQLGKPESAVHPQLAVIYPPVDREFMPAETPDRYWLRRLLPYVVFEDFKALTKIEKTLRIVGFRDFQFYNTGNTPDDLPDMNRVWICLPRNVLAQNQLTHYGNRVRFAFVRNASHLEIHWLPNRQSNSRLVIRSPLSIYLEEQRNGMPGGDWKAAHGRIVAKDFAILARFSDTRGRKQMPPDPLKDFFLAGIRGLGTWGAGWFLDRRCSDLEGQCERPNADVQFLLEVTYRNERILEVRDVSHEPQTYFDSENNLQIIRSRIRHYA